MTSIKRWVLALLVVWLVIGLAGCEEKRPPFDDLIPIPKPGELDQYSQSVPSASTSVRSVLTTSTAAE